MGSMFTVSALIGLTLGVLAPDLLEIPLVVTKRGLFVWETNKHVVKRVFAHRGNTHSIMLWAIAYYWSYSLSFVDINSDVQSVDVGFLLEHYIAKGMFWGFSFGGLMHLLGDIPNDRGIPLIITNVGPRLCFHLWKSRENEGICLMCITVIDAIISYLILEETMLDSITDKLDSISGQLHIIGAIRILSHAILAFVH